MGEALKWLLTPKPAARWADVTPDEARFSRLGDNGTIIGPDRDEPEASPVAKLGAALTQIGEGLDPVYAFLEGQRPKMLKLGMDEQIVDQMTAAILLRFIEKWL
jgi:hypothetical protein